MTQRILVVDDEEATVTGLKALLSGWGYEVEGSLDAEDALGEALKFRPALVIADLILPGMDGIAFLRALQQEQPQVPVIILTGHGTIESAVAATREGAYDYLTKPVDVQRLRILVEKALEKGEMLRQVSRLQARLKHVWGLGRLVGRSPAMQEVVQMVEMVAPTSAPVLITGETGTGKELVAHTLHDLSPRAKGPFVAVNCAAIPETLLESEIFGHEKGAFTGAFERRIGCFERADGGTLFLDEIAEMNTGTQVKFLRILQEGLVTRLGGKSETRVDVRVLAATNKDPLVALKDGSLREDLYYRLNVFSVFLPPLRARKEDIPLLIEAFLEEFSAKYEKSVKAVDQATLQVLLAHPWPGNVRELRNTIERAVIACPGEVIDTSCLSLTAAPGAPSAGGPADAVSVPLGTGLRDVEREVILRTLQMTGNNKTRAAEILGISQKTLHNKLQRYKQSP
ncbi:MAG TPA: sigma-54 dependent transcriptional regulator [Methylomirabilota bacterium]|nr:sigma-54 dependent transcriptional regulator [Methylomirabilota bacterium]